VKYILFTFFIIGLTLSGLSQQDTSLSKPIKLKQSFGGAIYGGIGVGGNKDKYGIAYAVNSNVHYKIHTINMYASLATKSEEISSGFDYSYTLYSSNYGFTYGLGFYEKNFSISGGVGIGYTRTNMILRDYNSTQIAGGFTSVFYSKVGGCAGVQATLHGRFVGFTIQSYINFSNAITNYVIIGGLAIVIR
jgi:hypothetical protein